MGTTLLYIDHVPATDDVTHSFFFNENYLLACHNTTSNAKLESLPGSGISITCHQKKTLSTDATTNCVRRYSNR